MITPTGRSKRGIGRTRTQRIARGPRGRVARWFVAAWLAVLALYAVTGSVAPAYAHKLPTVTSVTPSSGPGTGGTSVTIEGTFFKHVKAVKFGSTNATSFTVKSATSITATSPAGAVGTVDVTVAIAGNRSSATSSADHFEFTPTVTGVSPNTGPPAGGTTATVTGSGFAIGESATHITFEDTEAEIEVEAVGVNCATTTECTATTPEMSPEESNSTVDVRATVNNVVSPQTSADQFDYHGLWLLDERGRLRVGGRVESGLRGGVEASETSGGEVGCGAFVSGYIASNGETTDEIDIGVSQFTSCIPEQWFEGLPFSFALRLGDDGSATIEGPMGVRMGNGCVYEGDRMGGGFELNARLNAGLSGTFTLVAEEEPGAGCAATASVSVLVAAERFYPYAELVG
jgi:IPT/TIG domain